MAQRSLSERISLALQEQVYNIAAQVNEVVIDVVAAVEDGLKQVEDKVTPEYNINVNYSDVDAEKIAKQVEDMLGKAREAYAGREAPVVGDREESTPLSREQLLRELYKYAAAHSEDYIAYKKDYEDHNATNSSRFNVKSLVEAVKAELLKDIPERVPFD